MLRHPEKRHAQAESRSSSETVLFKLKPSLTEAKKDSFLPLCQEGLAKVPYGTEQVMGRPLSAALTQGFEYGA